jgi:hypothetical protein
MELPVVSMAARTPKGKQNKKMKTGLVIGVIAILLIIAVLYFSQAGAASGLLLLGSKPAASQKTQAAIAFIEKTYGPRLDASDFWTNQDVARLDAVLRSKGKSIDSYVMASVPELGLKSYDCGQMAEEIGSANMPVGGATCGDDGPHSNCTHHNPCTDYHQCEYGCHCAGWGMVTQSN